MVLELLSPTSTSITSWSVLHSAALGREEKGLMENSSSPVASAGPRKTDFFLSFSTLTTVLLVFTSASGHCSALLIQALLIEIYSGQNTDMIPGLLPH